MCVSAKPADFKGTRLLVNPINHPTGGHKIHVLGYQNTAISQVAEPNAMLLHLPAKPMSQGNFLDTASAPHFMADMENTLIPRDRGGSGRSFGTRKDSQVIMFEHGVYTIVLANNAKLIPKALEKVTRHKRPQISKELCAFYYTKYPRHTLVLCCFNNQDALTATPLLLWYEPLNPKLLVAPALDCHTGGVPDLNAKVEVDHWLFVGTDQHKNGARVEFSDNIDPSLQPFIPKNIAGGRFTGKMRNGDFAIDPDALKRNVHWSGEILGTESETIKRVGPDELGI